MKLNVGNKLHYIREDRKLTQSEMADLLGLPTSTYQRVERGMTSVELDQLVQFARQLNIPIMELLPDILSLHNNYNGSGQGGQLIFGNQYIYNYGSDVDDKLKQENEELRIRLEELENGNSSS